MTEPERDLQAWTAMWQQSAAPPSASESLARHVRRRSRLLTWWLIGEIVVVAVALAALAGVIATHSDPFERLAMVLLAAVCLGTLAFSWWNWRGSLRTVGETTAVYLQLSATRLERWRRELKASWFVFGAELVIFIPWIWYRQQSLPSKARWPWLFLAGMTVLGIGGLIALSRWVRREAAVLDRLRRELEEFE